MSVERKQYYDPGEPNLWVPNSRRQPEMSRDYLAYWFAKYGFVLLVCFFFALVLSAIAFLPELRHGSASEQLARQAGPGGVPASTISEDKAAAAADKETLLLNISSDPVGQTVYIDFDSVGVTPIYKMKVVTGVYVVSAGVNFESRTDTVIVATDTEPRWIMFGPDRKVTSRRSSPADTFLGQLPDSLILAMSDTVAHSDNGFEHILAGSEAPETERSTTNQADQQPVPVRRETTTTGREPQRTPVSPPRETTSEDDQVGTLVFASDPESAIVLLDDVLVGSTPLTLKGVPVGNHEITIKKEGFDDYSATIDVRPDESLVVNASLASAVGKLIVLVEPWGSIYIDGKLYKLETDIEYTTDLVAGTHVVTATHPTLGSVSQQVTLNGGERVRVTLTFDK